MGARSKNAPAGLSAARIRAEALRLIDEDGVEAFSTRKLGRALGCEAMAIYWYYPSKEALLDAVVDELMASLGRLPKARAGAREREWVGLLRRVAHGYRGLAHAHPKAFPLLATRRFATEGTYGFLEELFALARSQGLPDRTIARFFRAVSAYCNGMALSELAALRESEDPGIAAVRGKFPRVTAVFAWMAPRHHDDLFAFGLETLLGALALEARTPAARRT
jgi:AcrR family transcriptional regulator